MGMAMGAWKELGRAILTRRKELGLTQVEVTESGGPSRETLRLLELGERTNYRPATFMQLDTGLSWKPGTARSIVEGRADLSDPASWNQPTEGDDIPWGVDTSLVELPASTDERPHPHQPRPVAAAVAQAYSALQKVETVTPVEQKAVALVSEALRLLVNNDG